MTETLRHSLLLDNGRLAGFDKDRSLLLVLRHLRVLVVALPETAAQDLDACVVHLLPAVKTATLTHGADAARAHVMHVVKEHLVPAVAAAQAEGHDGVQHGPVAIGVRCQEIVPKVRVVQIRNEHPSRGEADAAGEVGPQHESPALAQREAHALRAEKPDRTPKAEEEEHVLDAAGK